MDNYLDKKLESFHTIVLIIFTLLASLDCFASTLNFRRDNFSMLDLLRCLHSTSEACMQGGRNADAKIYKAITSAKINAKASIESLVCQTIA